MHHHFVATPQSDWPRLAFRPAGVIAETPIGWWQGDLATAPSAGLEPPQAEVGAKVRGMVGPWLASTSFVTKWRLSLWHPLSRRLYGVVSVVSVTVE